MYSRRVPMVTDSCYLQSPVLGISDIRNVFHRKTKSSATGNVKLQSDYNSNFHFITHLRHELCSPIL